MFLAKMHEQVWCTVETNQGHSVFHVADQSIKDRVELAVIIKMPCAGASGFNNNGQRKRLRVSVLIECETLRYAIVGDNKVVSRELKDNLSTLGLRQDRNLNQS